MEKEVCYCFRKPRGSIQWYNIQPISLKDMGVDKGGGEVPCGREKKELL